MKHTSVDPSATRTVGPLKATAFVAIPLVLLAAVLEFAAGLYLNSRTPGFDLQVQGIGQMAPSGYQLWEHPPGYRSWSRLTRFNNLGFRRFQDTARLKPPGTIRVFLTGGSAALGSQANPKTPYYRMSGQGEYSNDETITAHLERLWGERHPGQKIEVINSATNWTQLHQQMIHYHRKLRSLQPDLVISMDGQNDALVLGEDRLNVWDAAISRSELLQSDFRMRARPMLTRSNALYLGAILLFGAGKPGRIPPDMDLVNEYKDKQPPADLQAQYDTYYAANKGAVERVVGEYLTNMQHFNDALRRDGVRALFVMQPQLSMDHTKPLTEIERAIRNHLVIHDDGFGVNFFRQVEARGNALRESHGLQFYSMLQPFEGVTDEVYTDYCHLTPSGNEHLARRLLALIERTYPDLFKNPGVSRSPPASPGRQ